VSGRISPAWVIAPGAWLVSPKDIEVFVKNFLLAVLAVILLVEEWIWDVLTSLGRRLIVWLHLLSFDNWLIMATPGVALAAFAIPVAVLTPVNFFALWMMANGQFAEGVALYVIAKLVATLLVSHMFVLTREKLLTFSWFALLYGLITRALKWAHEQIRDTAVYRQAHHWKHLASVKVAGWLRG
jgi:hypothetical protein